MARKRVISAAATPPAPADDGSVRDGFMSALIGDLKNNNKFTCELMSNAAAAASTVGLRLPSLSLQYLFSSTVLPLSRLISITGVPGSGKSTLLAEFYRWFLLRDGLAFHQETENKDEAANRNALYRQNSELMARQHVHYTGSLDEWIQHQNAIIDAIDRQCAKVGWRFPVCLGVDSYTQMLSGRVIEKFEAEGPTQRYATEAKVLSDWTKFIQPRIAGKPLCIVGVLHLRTSKDSRGFNVDTVSGGFALRFSDALEIRMTPLETLVLASENRRGFKVMLEMLKNSHGEKSRRLAAQCWWFRDPKVEGTAGEHAAWNWGAATAEMLMEIQKTPNRWAELQKILDINVSQKVKKSENQEEDNAKKKRARIKLWSKRAGIAEKSPVSMTEFGNAIDADLAIQRELHSFLDIREHAELPLGEDHKEFRQRLIAEVGGGASVG